MVAAMNARRAAAALALAIALGCGAEGAGAQGRDLEYEPVPDAIVTGAAAAVWLLGGVFNAELAPDGCRWCDRDGERDTLNRFDRGVGRALRWRDTERADWISDVTAYGLGPASAFGLTGLLAVSEGRGGEWATDAGLIAEAVAVAGATQSIVRLAVARQRPFVHRLPPAERDAIGGEHEPNVSFYSGHTSAAFALAAASGTVAILRGRRHAWAVWAVGMSAAAATGYLRIAADRHHATDVLTGALVGSLIGAALPVWLGRPDRRLEISATPAGVALGGVF